MKAWIRRIVDRIARGWSARFFAVERSLAVLITVGFVCWSEFSARGQLRLLFDGNRSSFYNAIASVVGALLGFSIAAQAIVLGFIPAPKMAIVRNSKPFKDLRLVFHSVAKCLGIATGLALLGLVVDRDYASSVTPPYIIVPYSLAIWVFYLLILFLILGSFRLMRVYWVLNNVVELMTRNEVSAPEPNATQSSSTAPPPQPAAAPNSNSTQAASEEVISAVDPPPG